MVQLGCDFEVDTCAWNDTAPDGYFWTRRSGPAPYSYATGPSGDHTTGSGFYLFTRAYHNGARYNKLHRLESPLFSLQQDATLSFAYHMYGSSMGTLSVEAHVDGSGWSPLWSKTGDQGDAWRDAAVVLPASATQVRFNGETGPGFSSDMALDDVSFSQFVPPASPPSPPSPPPQRCDSYSAVKYVCSSNDGSGNHGFTGNNRTYLGTPGNSTGCRALCEEQSEVGCCEWRSSNHCNWKLNADRSYSPAHTDSTSFLCLW